MRPGSDLAAFVRQHDFPCWCGERRARLACRQTFGARPFAVLECSACRTHRVLPRALQSQADAEQLYNVYTDAFTLADLEQIKTNILRRCRAVGMPFGPDKSVLDIGCGSGFVLNAICGEYGCEGHGIDVDQRRINLARTRARRAVFECALFDPGRLERRYEIVLLNAVIEHVVDPAGFLAQVKAALATGGSLFLLTPNASSLSYRILKSWWRELLSIGEHIYLFTPESLAACAARAGLHVEKISSDFDFARPRLKLGRARDALVSAWGCYREAIKRAASLICSDQTGDILYARLTHA